MILLARMLFEGKFYRLSGDCHSNWIHPKDHELEHESSAHALICCPSDFFQTTSDRPCYSGMHHLHVLSSFMGAWILPLVVPLSWCAEDLDQPPRLGPHLERILRYLGLMAYRSFVIYPFFNWIEERLVSSFDSTCSFGHLRRNLTCPGAFDHADHVVLFLVHYLLISSLEWNYMLTQRPRSVARSSVTYVQLRQVYLIVLNLVVVFVLFQTLTSFHSISESLVAWVIAVTCVVCPYRRWFTRPPESC